MFDLIIKGGTLPDGQVSDIGIVGDKITAIGSIQTAEAGKVIDASGDLVSPPFVDPHFHMDATLSYGLPRINTSGTLLEGIGLWGELKQVMTQDDIIGRALTYCDWAASMGLLAIRSHVDTCDDRLLGVEALLEVRETGQRLYRSTACRLPTGRFLPRSNGTRKHHPRLGHGCRCCWGYPAFRTHHGQTARRR